MQTSVDPVVRICFAILLAVGVLPMILGLVIIPLRPIFQLDVVLSEAELADREKRDATFHLLKKASGNERQLTTMLGVVVVSASVVGLRGDAKMRSACQGLEAGVDDSLLP